MMARRPGRHTRNSGWFKPLHSETPAQSKPRHSCQLGSHSLQLAKCVSVYLKPDLRWRLKPIHPHTSVQGCLCVCVCVCVTLIGRLVQSVPNFTFCNLEKPRGKVSIHVVSPSLRWYNFKWIINPRYWWLTNEVQHKPRPNFCHISHRTWWPRNRGERASESAREREKFCSRNVRKMTALHSGWVTNKVWVGVRNPWKIIDHTWKNNMFCMEASDPVWMHGLLTLSDTDAESRLADVIEPACSTPDDVVGGIMRVRPLSPYNSM